MEPRVVLFRAGMISTKLPVTHAGVHFRDQELRDVLTNLLRHSRGYCNRPAGSSARCHDLTWIDQADRTAGQTQPPVSTMNSPDERIKANAAIVGLGSSGAASIFVTDAAHVVLDVNGYFVPPGTPGGLAFYPAQPCRVLDTRVAGGGGRIAANATRSISGGCLPTQAQAYLLNVTTVPPGPLGYLTLWPNGSAQPRVSTLNNLTATVVATLRFCAPVPEAHSTPL